MFLYFIYIDMGMIFNINKKRFKSNPIRNSYNQSQIIPGRKRDIIAWMRIIPKITILVHIIIALTTDLPLSISTLIITSIPISIMAYIVTSQLEKIFKKRLISKNFNKK